MPWWGTILLCFSWGIWTVLCVMLGQSLAERVRFQRITEERAKWFLPDINKEP